eukprot:58538-Alexandrium_andersonii.AAC.1
MLCSPRFPDAKAICGHLSLLHALCWIRQGKFRGTSAAQYVVHLADSKACGLLHQPTIADPKDRLSAKCTMMR